MRFFEIMPCCHQLTKIEKTNRHPGGGQVPSRKVSFVFHGLGIIFTRVPVNFCNSIATSLEGRANAMQQQPQDAHEEAKNGDFAAAAEYQGCPTAEPSHVSTDAVDSIAAPDAATVSPRRAEPSTSSNDEQQRCIAWIQSLEHSERRGGK
jgi:hypothetical protein